MQIQAHLYAYAYHQLAAGQQKQKLIVMLEPCQLVVKTLHCRCLPAREQIKRNSILLLKTVRRAIQLYFRRPPDILWNALGITRALLLQNQFESELQIP